MNLQQINEFLLRLFDGSYDIDIDVTLPDSEIDAIVLFLKTEGYINFEPEDYSISFTDKGYAILFKFNEGTNVDKLSMFGELKKIAEKFYGQRQKVGNIE
jgi:hypothetical protein